ncbi:MAG: cation:proton antiporter [Dehalococcoidales bacterium]|nr:cation:proton antiporter [Dehalococcoidales bacterium]
MTADLSLAIGIMITVGLLGGILSNKIKFPRVTGYIIIGIIFSPSILNLVSRATIERLDIVTHVTLGIVAYLIGASLRIESIRKLGRSIAWITPTQSLGAWLVVTLALAFIAPRVTTVPGATFMNNYLPMALVAGAIASATAPAVTMAVIREYRARGPLTTTLLAVVAIDDAIAVIAFAISAGIAQSLVIGSGSVSLYHMLAVPALEIAQSIGIGVALGFALIYLTRLLKTRALLLAAVLGMILLGTGLANYLGISLIMTNMTLGFVVANRMRDSEATGVIENIEEVVFAIFFVFSGMHFEAGFIRTAGTLALLLFGVRFAGKYFGTMIGARISRASEEVKKYLGLALVPQAGVALGLALLAEEMFPTLGHLLFNVVLGSVIINEIVAPPLTKYAITKSGEAGVPVEPVSGAP